MILNDQLHELKYGMILTIFLLFYYKGMQGISSSFAPIVEQGIQNSHLNHSYEDEDKNQTKRQQDIHSQEMMDSVKVELNSANQILSPHKNIKDHNEKISFKLSSTVFYKQNSRANQTLFPSISLKSKQIQAQGKGQSPIETALKQELGDFACFMNDKKTLIYQRIKNEKMNYLFRSEKAKQKSAITKAQAKYFSSLFINPKISKNKSKQRPVWQHLKDEYDLQDSLVGPDALQFDSAFEGGNLFAVFRDKSANFPTYELFMQNDINTKGSTQWFYFRVSNKIRMKAKFRILNFYKPTSLYQSGMKILISADGMQWKRVGTAITYSKNTISSKDSYSLQFVYEFQTPAKSIYFCYGYPYNYTSKLIPFLECIQNKNYSKKCIKKTVLCKSTMGNDVHLISISNNILFMKIQKPIIYVIARQHPGQTPSSFVMEGFLNFLLSNRLEAEALREQFEFRIVPMVNVDGVISGNYRTNISGNDVNRQWIFPSKALHPEIYYLKQEIISNKRNVIFFLDIHSHSRKMNSFFYGSKEINGANKMYPFVCSKLNKFISYSESAFNDDPSKMSTGRVVVQKELNLVNSLTFELSFFGWVDSVKKTKHHFRVSELQEIGMSLALGLYYTEISIKKAQEMGESITHKRNQKEKTIYKNSLKIYEKWKAQLQKQMKNEDDILSEGSSIDPQQFTLKKEEILNVQTQNNSVIQNLSAHTSQQNLPQNKSKDRTSIDFFQNSISTLNTLKLTKGARRYSKTQKNPGLGKFSDYELEMNEQQTEAKKSNLFSYSGNDFFLMSSKNFMMHQLQVELQGKSKASDPKYMTIDEQKVGRKKALIDFRQTFRYQDKIKQIKRAFNYCVNNNTSVDHYQSYYKSFTPQLESSSQFGNRNGSLPKKSHNFQAISNQNRTIELFPHRKKRELSLVEKRHSFPLKRQPFPEKLQKI